jgi:outer membrane protein assembly factor BamB
MTRRVGLISVSFLGIGLFFESTVVAQKLEFLWKKDFPKSVSWYVRTSAGILLVRTERSLTALNGADGSQLWEISGIDSTYWNLGGVAQSGDRSRNVIELPWMGVLLLNRLKLGNESEPKLVAINLTTGQRMWEQPQVDDLMTALPLYESGGIVLVSRRLQKKVLAAEMVIGTGAQFPFMLDPFLPPYPYRFEIERRDLATGKVQWSTEYPHTFTPGMAVVNVFGANVFVYYGNRALGCLDGNNGKLLWEDGMKHLGTRNLPLPLQMADGRLIYGSKSVRAVDPETGKEAWTIEKLGKVIGIFVHDGLAVAIGEKRIAAVDTASGLERWRKKTDGHTTNLLWEKSSDTLLYADWKGLHRVDRTTGKSLLDARLQIETPPHYLRMASPATVVTIGYNETDCYNTETGKKLFTEAKLSALFRADAFLDDWPIPEDGQELVRVVPAPSGAHEWENVRRRTLLSATTLQNLEETATEPNELLDVYQTETEKGEKKIWWVDGQTNRQMIIRPAAKQHDVNRALGNVFAVDGKMLWAATIEMK